MILFAASFNCVSFVYLAMQSLNLAKQVLRTFKGCQTVVASELVKKLRGGAVEEESSELVKKLRGGAVEEENSALLNKLRGGVVEEEHNLRGAEEVVRNDAFLEKRTLLEEDSVDEGSELREVNVEEDRTSVEKVVEEGSGLFREVMEEENGLIEGAVEEGITLIEGAVEEASREIVQEIKLEREDVQVDVTVEECGGRGKERVTARLGGIMTPHFSGGREERDHNVGGGEERRRDRLKSELDDRVLRDVFLAQPQSPASKKRRTSCSSWNMLAASAFSFEEEKKTLENLRNAALKCVQDSCWSVMGTCWSVMGTCWYPVLSSERGAGHCQLMF